MMAQERDFRGPGCSEDCQIVRAILPGVFGRSDLMLHAAEAHEAYGRRMSGPWREAPAVIVTGRLTVDVRRLIVTVDGAPVHLTPTETRMLRLLAIAEGEVVPVATMIREALSSGYSLTPNARHAIRLNISRLRGRLHAAEGLIVTVHSHGYRLEMIEAGADAPPRQGKPNPFPRLGRWAKAWDQCRTCGTRESPHNDHGYCSRCRHRAVKVGAA